MVVVYEHNLHSKLCKLCFRFRQDRRSCQSILTPVYGFVILELWVSSSAELIVVFLVDELCLFLKVQPGAVLQNATIGPPESLTVTSNWTARQTDGRTDKLFRKDHKNTHVGCVCFHAENPN